MHTVVGTIVCVYILSSASCPFTLYTVVYTHSHNLWAGFPHLSVSLCVSACVSAYSIALSEFSDGLFSIAVTLILL